MGWISRVRCWITGHPGVFREWEWRPTAAQWKEREDAWTCIRCAKEMHTIPAGVTSYVVARPFMDSRVVDYVNEAVESHGAESVRVRASGDLATLRPRTSAHK